MMTDTSSYLNEDLAKKVGEKIKEKNPRHKIIVEVIETKLFEDESEVPILNNEEA
jgi:EAL domain-containing protein (putative c-di-GMP-specific phosphodiesterase class I)